MFKESGRIKEWKKVKKIEDGKSEQEMGIQNGFRATRPQKFKMDKFFRDRTSIVTGVFVVKYTLKNTLLFHSVFEYEFSLKVDIQFQPQQYYFILHSGLST